MKALFTTALAAFATAAITPTTNAQQVPLSGGSSIIAFAEAVAPPAVGDQISFVDTNTAVPGSFIPAALTVPLGGTEKITTTSNRLLQQVPTLPELVLGNGITSGPGVLFAPTTDSAGLSFIAAIDFRPAGGPSVSSFPASGSSLPYDILDDASHQRVFTISSNQTSFSLIESVSYATSPPTQLSSAITLSLPSAFCTRIVIDPSSGNLIIPFATGIEIYNPISMALLATIPTPLGAGGVPLLVGTNVNPNFKSAGGATAIVGLRDASATQHGWLAFDGTGTSTFSVSSGVNPFGAGLTLAAGFNEVQVHDTPAGRVATFLLDQAGSIGTGTGAVAQITSSNTGITATTTAIASPFGNLEAARNGTLDPLAFQISTASSDAIACVGVGISYTAGAVSAPVMTTGLINPADSDAPRSLPGSLDFELHSSIGVTARDIFSVLPPTLPMSAPQVSLTSTRSNGGSAVTLTSIVQGGPLSGVAVATGAFGGLAAGTTDCVLTTTPPLTPGTFHFNALTGIPVVAIPGGGLVTNPATSALPPTITARWPAYNANQGGTLLNVSYAYESASATFPSGVAIAQASAFGNVTAIYPTFIKITSEILSL